MDSHSVRRTFSASGNLVGLLHMSGGGGGGATNSLVQSSPQRGVVRSESGALPRAASPLEAGPTADAESTPVHGSSRSARRDAREAFSQADVIDSGLARLHSFELPLSLADDVDDIDISLPLSEEYLLSKIQEVQYQLQQLREGRDGAAATPAASRQPGGRKRGRLFVVSNRLPVQLQFAGPHHSSRPKVLLSVSGLQSALRSLRSRFSIRWIGRLAQEQQLTPAQQQMARQVLATEHGYVPVFVDAGDGRLHRRFCNSILWRIFHYLPVGIEGERAFSIELWEAYRRVNAAYVDTMVGEYQEGDLFWVHDFQLMLVPQLMRARVHDAKIGFFLHTPFPSSEVYRILPTRRRLLEGILAADLIGFHTYDYARHFLSVCSRTMGLDTRPNGVDFRGALVHVGTYPFSIDMTGFVKALRSRAVQLRQHKLRDDLFAGKRIVLGVDRLDYIKGIPHKMLAFEHLLEAHPEWIGRVILVQVAVPAAGGDGMELVDEQASGDYSALRTEVDEMVGRINGRFGTVEEVPIVYRMMAPTFEELVALYSVADVAALTSLREGMGLMSYEYTVCQADRCGALVMSEFCGAAQSLPGAILCNPWSVEEVGEALHRALTMSPMEREIRHRKLYKYIQMHTAEHWAENIVSDLVQFTEQRRNYRRLDMEALLPAYATARRRLLLLDYDGTLAPFHTQPELAKPSPQLLRVLKRLQAAPPPSTTVFVISGRERETLGRWLAGTGVGLAAEQGYAICWPAHLNHRPSREHSCRPGGADDEAPSPLRDAHGNVWTHPPFDFDPDAVAQAMRTAIEVMLRFEDATPGSFTHIKESSITWHFAAADPQFAYFQAQELRAHLEESLAQTPLVVLSGKSIVYVRPRGVDKGSTVRYILSQMQEQYPEMVLCVGDDKSDEHMFEACQQAAAAATTTDGLKAAPPPPRVFTCTVGRKGSAAQAFVERVDDVIECLERLAALTPSP